MDVKMWAVKLLNSRKAYFSCLSAIVRLTNNRIALHICRYHARSYSSVVWRQTSSLGIFEKPCIVNVNKYVLSPENNIVNKLQVRLKHGKGKKDRPAHDEESDSNEEDSDDDESAGFSVHYQEDENLPNNCSQIKKNVKSLRIDSIVSAGLNISRNKVDEYFLSSKLLLNGEKVLKKSKQMSEGDWVDLISEAIASEEDKMKVKRVRVVKVDENKSSKGKMTVYLRCWRGNVLIDKVEKWTPRSRKDDQEYR